MTFAIHGQLHKERRRAIREAVPRLGASRDRLVVALENAVRQQLFAPKWPDPLDRVLEIPMPGFRSLLTPDLAGWRMAGPGGFRWAAEGVLESYGGTGLFWYADEVFEDFILRAEWRITRIEDNSGIFLRCPRLGDDPQPAIERGFEIQIDDRGFDPETKTLNSPLHLTGAVYTLAPATCLASRPVGSWNEFEIAARGPTIAVQLNGRDVCRLDNAGREPRGHIGLQNHHDGSEVQFRNLRIKRLER